MDNSYTLMCKELENLDAHISKYETELAHMKYGDTNTDAINEQRLEEQLRYMKKYRSVLVQRKNEMLILAYLQS
jgi:hypothetical protein